jgi:hypothetical protein
MTAPTLSGVDEFGIMLDVIQDLRIEVEVIDNYLGFP